MTTPKITNDTNKYKKGTVGYAAQQLAAKYGNSTNGILILQFALEKAIGDMVQIGNAPRYKSLLEDEKNLLKELGL